MLSDVLRVQSCPGVPGWGGDHGAQGVKLKSAPQGHHPRFKPGVNLCVTLQAQGCREARQGRASSRKGTARPSVSWLPHPRGHQPALEQHSFLACSHTPTGPSANSAAALLWRTCLRSRWPKVTWGGGRGESGRQLTSSKRSMLAFRQGMQDLSSLFSSSSCCSLSHKNKAGTRRAVPRPPHAPTQGPWAKASHKPGWCLHTPPVYREAADTE